LYFLAGLLVSISAPAYGQAGPPAMLTLRAPRVMPVLAPETASLQCRNAIEDTERALGIPDQLLAAIGRVESGREDPLTHRVSPWPWTINAEGRGAVFETKEAAIAAVQDLQARGVRSIDVGCLQVNLMHHPEAFASLDIAFDPAANAGYAGRFLSQLYGRIGDWSAAAAAYHSMTPEVGAEYQRKVMAVWPQGAGQGAPARNPARAPVARSRSDLAAAWAATLPDGASGGAASGGRVAVMLPANPDAAPKILPVPQAPPAALTGRNLDSYRAMPVLANSRLFRPGG
jgi:hypothetical protein